MAIVPAKEVTQSLRSLLSFKKLFRDFLLQRLQSERDKYEHEVASEYQRGRIAMLREILDLTKD